MFPYKPPLSQYLTNVPSQLDNNLIKSIGDIKQPWADLADPPELDEFSAKTFFVIGMIRRYILSANAILGVMDHEEFLTAYLLLCVGIELLGRCCHPDKLIRQHPTNKSNERLKEGFEFIRRSHLPQSQVVATNHFKMENGGYSIEDLINLRNLVAHGGGITKATTIKGDVELLNELRTALWCVPNGDSDPQLGTGPREGALDRYFVMLATGDIEMCDRLASAAVSPVPVQLQQNHTWRFDKMLIEEIKDHINNNLQAGAPPVSGGF